MPAKLRAMQNSTLHLVPSRPAGSTRVFVRRQAMGASTSRTCTGCKNITANTSFSSIQVRLPENASYSVTARTSLGRIRTDFPVTASGLLGGDTLNGKIGNGGCTLSLVNSNGGIEILKLAN